MKYKKFLSIFLLFVASVVLMNAGIYIFNTRQTAVIKEISTNLIIIRDYSTLKSVLRPALGLGIGKISIFQEKELLFSVSERETPNFYINNYSAELLVGNKKTHTVTVSYTPAVYILAIFVSCVLTAILYILIDYFQQKIRMKIYLSELAEKLAHDIRSPISTLQLISVKIENSEIKELQQNVVNQINNIAAELLNRFGKSERFSKKDKQQQVLLESIKKLEHEWSLKSASLKRNIIFRLSDINRDIKIKESVFSLVYRCINNFIQNSIEATQEGENIFVEFKVQGLDLMEIKVIDRGSGIPENILKKIGKKRLSSKEKSQSQFNSGHGLAMLAAKSDLKKIGAQMTIFSKPNHGTEVTLRIPLATD